MNETNEVNCIVSNSGVEFYIETNERVYSIVKDTKGEYYMLNCKQVDSLPNTPKVKILLAAWEKCYHHISSIVCCYDNKSLFRDEINKQCRIINTILKGV